MYNIREYDVHQCWAMTETNNWDVAATNIEEAKTIATRNCKMLSPWITNKEGTNVSKAGASCTIESMHQGIMHCIIAIEPLN